MKEPLRFRSHRIARAVRAGKPSGPAKLRAVTPRQPLPGKARRRSSLCRTYIRAAIGARDPCNPSVHDRIRAHAMPVHGHGLIERP